MNVYAVPGGYQCFQEKLNETVEKYRLVPGKGIQVGRLEPEVPNISGVPKGKTFLC